jgi:hypothetical protein
MVAAIQPEWALVVVLVVIALAVMIYLFFGKRSDRD